MRHRSVPERTVGAQIVIARPHDGAAFLLPATAALIWQLTADWVVLTEVSRELERWHPEVEPQQRADALTEIITMLDGMGLLERSSS